MSGGITHVKNPKNSHKTFYTFPLFLGYGTFREREHSVVWVNIPACTSERP